MDLLDLCNFFSDDTIGPASAMFRQANFINPSLAAMNDWNVGDVFEYSTCLFSSGNINGCSIPAYYGLDTIIAKNISSYGVEYITHGWRATIDTILGFNNAIYAIVPFSDTVFFSFTNYVFPPDFMPEEYQGFSFYEPFYYYFPNDTSFCGIGDKYYTCSDQCGISWVQSYRIDKVGIGLVHYNHFDGSQGAIVSDSTLHYFVKSGTSCGTYILPDTSMPVSIVNTILQHSFRVYPNPANSQLVVEAGFSNYNLSLVNIMGQAVYTKASCGAKEIINAEQLANGIYYLKLETGSQTINRKILIQH